MSTFLMEDIGKTAGGVLLPTVTKAFTLPIDTYWNAQRAIGDYTSQQDAWYKNPCALPSPDTLLELMARGMGESDRVMRGALRMHGIDTYLPAGLFRATDQRRRMWSAVEALKLEVPSVSWALDMLRRKLIVRQDAERLIRRAGGDFEKMTEFMDLLDERPGVSEILRAWAEQRIETDDARPLFRSAGTDINLWEGPRAWQMEAPGIQEMIEWTRRGLLPDTIFRDMVRWKRLDHHGFWPLYQNLTKALPGVSDLLRMGNRQLFSPEVVADYGLFDEFPESIRPYFAQLGLDYPINLNLPANRGGGQLSLPVMYWAMIKEILPLNAAYLAYQRLRPDQVAKFQDEVPGLRPFLLEDLQYHMRVAGYPPPMRDFLVALSHPPLGRRDIQNGVRYLGWNVAQTLPYVKSLGFSRDDAQLISEMLIAKEEDRENAWKESIERRAHTSTVSAIEGLYNDGLIDRTGALRNLSAAGLSDALSVQLLDLSDASRARVLLREAVTATGRDYLAGVLSAVETIGVLRVLGINDARSGELMQIWTIRRSRRRKQADTGRILKWVSTGRLTAQDARRRLDNLGWTDPDLLLLVAEAEGNLDKLRAREQKAADQEQTRRAKELARLEKEAKAEARRLRSEANRVAPRSVLLKWLQDRVISEADFRSLMGDRGYPQEEIDRYVKDATTPKPPRPKAPPAGRAFPRPEGSSHPSLAMLEKWYLTEVISLATYDSGLEDLGYGPTDRQRIIAATDLKHSAKGTTRQPPAPAPPETSSP